ncbi:hypothetical protein Axi01nite_92770 [Actinoplanes xinjiangensis]|nr:hypothetical protein Axi01nite_92770 [Actinoplanes xinjiangensis]
MTWTECASAQRAFTVPEATIRLNRAVVATCHCTAMGLRGIPPCPSALSGRTASRVQSTTLVGAGSPEATPSLNGFRGPAVAEEDRTSDPAAAAPPRMK